MRTLTWKSWGGVSFSFVSWCPLIFFSQSEHTVLIQGDRAVVGVHVSAAWGQEVQTGSGGGS